MDATIQMETAGGYRRPRECNLSERVAVGMDSRRDSGSEEWLGGLQAEDYAVARAKDGTCGDWIIRFSSGVCSQWQANNWFYGSFFRARTNEPVVVVVPQRNAKLGEQVNLWRWLKRFGISALRLSIPYHDWRTVPGHPRADFLVGPNIGLTLQANRQAVSDLRRAVRWLEMGGYTRIDLVGTSIGSALSCTAISHGRAIRAGVRCFMCRLITVTWWRAELPPTACGNRLRGM
jgi:hypothetical protein